MEVSNEKICPRAGPIEDGESRTASSDAVWPMYTGGANIAGSSEVAVDTARKEERGERTKQKEVAAATSGARVPVAKVQRLKTKERSRTATPVSSGSRFYGTDGGTSDEYMSGADTAVSCSRGEETEKEDKERERIRRTFLKRRGSLSPEERDMKRKSSTKRGRGRPPTTGEYVDLAKAKRDANEQLRALETEPEREIVTRSKTIRQLRSHRLSESSSTSDVSMVGCEEVTAATLGAAAATSLEAITEVANKSKHLKGTLAATQLKKAATTLREVYGTLLSHTTSEETRALEAANARLSREIQELKTKMEVIKRKLTDTRPCSVPTSSPSELSVEELLQRAVREAVSLTSARMDARLESLETRLLPEPRLRPPLAADKKTARDAPSTSRATEKNPESEASVSTLSPPLNPGPAQKKMKSKKMSAAAKEAATARRDAASKPAASKPPSTEWTEVVKKKGKVQMVQKKKEERKKVPEKGKKKSVKLRVPRSAALVLTLQPDAEKRGVSYKDILAKAKQRVDLAALDIPAVKFKVAVTGARMLEIPGAANRDKAGQLAAKLKEVMEEEDVRVSCPQKCAELRLYGLDDSATVAEIAHAIAAPGGCTASDVKVSAIKQDRRGRGMAWVKCPVEAAKKVTAPNTRVFVGWTVVHVVLLIARPMRCYKCHATGHSVATCPNEVDRRGLCFRCGQPDHTSTQCQNQPHCALCADSGKPADHSVGSRACGKPAPRERRSKSSGASRNPVPHLATESGSRVAPMEQQ